MADERTGIKYIGKDATYKDRMFGTGLVWRQGEVLPISIDLAKDFLKHPSLFAEAPGFSYLGVTTSAQGVGFPSGGTTVPLAAARDNGIVVPVSAQAQGYRVLIFGSSSTQRCTSAVNGFVTIPAVSYYGWMNAFSHGRFSLIKNAGVYGDTLQACAARVDTDVLPYSPDLIIWQISSNGMYGAQTLDAELAAAKVILQKLMTTGARIAVLLPHYWSSAAGNAPGREKLSQLIQGLKHMLYRCPGVVVVSSDSIINDVSTAEPITGLLEDGIHTTSAGAQPLGRALANAITPFFPDYPWEHNTSAAIYNAADSTTFDRPVRNQNPFFMGAGGAAAGTGISGTIAASTELSHYTTGGAVVASLVASPRGVGQAQRLVISGATQDDRYTLIQYVSGSNPLTEQAAPLTGYYRGLCRVKATGASALRNLGLSVSTTATGAPASEITTLWRFNTAVNIRDKPFALADFDVTLATEIFCPGDFYTAGQRTGLSMTATVAFDGAGAGTFDFYDFQLIRVG